MTARGRAIPLSRAARHADSAQSWGAAALLAQLGARAPGLLTQLADAAARASDAFADAARVGRFTRGWLEWEPRDDDVFVCTYPRSGTTWMLYLLHVLVRGPGHDEFAHIGQVCPWWERQLAHGRATARAWDDLPGPRLFKTHLPYRWLPRRGRIIYIERSGEDVAVSYYHLYRSHLGFRGTFAEFFDRFLRGDLQYRSWFDHVAAWRARRADPRVLHLRYEDMAADIERCVRRVVAFLELAVDERDIARAIEAARFDNMKALEHKFDHIGELLLDRGIERGAFIREGAVAGGARRLSDAQRRELAARSRRVFDRASRPGALPGAGPAASARPDTGLHPAWHLAAFLH